MKFSSHALNGHQDDKWNAVTIFKALKGGRICDIRILRGQTSVVYCGRIEGEYVGLILSKDEKVIVTGFAAPLDYWLSV